MEPFKSVHLKFLFGVLILAALACQSTAPTNTPVVAPSPIPATTGPGGSSSANAPVDLPSKRADQAGDINSSSMASKKAVAGGDVFVSGLYERPFNANTMDTYFPYIDIIDTQGFMDATWGYTTITLAGVDKNGKLSAQYAAELDLNKDGRGDWLIVASSPYSTTWSTTGVQAWKDANGTVGGDAPLIADNNPASSDGYETLVFDQGKGTLADGAWARISPSDPNTMQIAFKLSMLGNPTSYAMGTWAGANIDPSKFDYNDHMTHVHAGDPNTGYAVYPIKALAEVDNTCRLAIGFTPTGKEPGLCKNPAPVIAGPCPAGQTYFCGGIAAVNCVCR